jgi:hypothetical protein
VSLIEFLTVHYNKNIVDVLTNPQGDNATEVTAMFAYLQKQTEELQNHLNLQKAASKLLKKADPGNKSPNIT